MLLGALMLAVAVATTRGEEQPALRKAFRHLEREYRRALEEPLPATD